MIVKHNLLNFKDKIIYQNDDYFTFSLDSLLLANFTTLNPTTKTIVDFCSENAPIPMFLTYKTNAVIYGIELQKEVYELGKKSIDENNFSDKIKLINADVNEIDKYFDAGSIDLITCNPPYFKYHNDKFINDNEIKTIARHELKLTLDDMIKKSSYLLKNGGYLSLVHRPDRLIEIINTMQKYNIEPKKIRFVYPKVGQEANILLIEGVKNGKPFLKNLPPLIVHNEDGSYVEEIKNMFGGETHVAK